MFRGGGMHVGMVPASHGGTGVGIAAILVLVIGLASYAILADRRQPVSAASGSEPVQFLGHKPTAEQGRKAA